MTRNRSLIVFMSVFVVLLSESGVQAATDCELGQRLRRALGLGVMELATMGVSSATHTSIAQSAETFCSQNKTTIEPLIVAAEAARAAASKAYETGAADITAKDTAHRTALTTLATASNSLMTTVHASLTTAQVTQHNRRRANPLLDISIAMLDLTATQRTSIRTAQETRDKISRHHKKRKSHKKVREAKSAFSTSVDATLTAAQKTERTQQTTTRNANFEARAITESTLCSE